MFIHCENTECVNYYEDNCMLDLNNKMVCLDKNGKCENMKPGVNECYQEQGKEG